MTRIALTIKGDWNDADYVEERHEFDLDEVIITENVAGTLREVKAFEFWDRFATSLNHFKSIEEYRYKHNWYNYEGEDSRSYQVELVEHFLNSIQYIEDEKDVEEARQYLIELLDEFMPRGDCVGIHSIEAIHYAPIDSVTVLFGRP